MNHKYLEIWLRFRKRKYDRDLSKLQNDLAERGLAFSSAREREEGNLLNDYKDEIALKTEKSNACEEENQAKKVERRNSISTNRILASVAVLSLVLTLAISWITTQRADTEFKLRMRPYLTIENVEGNTDLATGKSNYRIFIKNSGNLPARVLSEAMDCPSKETPSFVQKSDVIGIGQSIVKPISLQSIKEVTCSITIKYRSAVVDFSEEIYETQQSFIYEFGKQMGSGGGYMK